MANHTVYTVHPIDQPGERDLAPLYALICSDGTGYALGTLAEVEEIAGKLNRLIDTAEHDGSIDQLDERLGWRWLTIRQAVELAADETGQDVPPVTIRRACAAGNIGGAKKEAGAWRMPAVRFRWWLNNVYAPRPAARKDAGQRPA